MFEGMDNMDARLFAQLTAINQSVIQLRGLYSLWSSAHGISYNEMLVLYALREKGYCTQKSLCESYRLPRQTMNNVIAALRKRGLLAIDPALSRGREKAFVLTDTGRAKAQPLIDALEQFETRAASLAGEETLAALTRQMDIYNRALEQALAETEKAAASDAPVL